MNSEEQVDRVLESWLAVGPTGLSDRSVAAIVDQLDNVKQRRLFWLPGLRGGFPVDWFVPALGSAAVVVVAAAVALNFYADQPAVGGPVASADPRTSFLGTWVSTSDADGGTQTMTVRAAQDGAVEIVVTDDVASVCSLRPSTMTGTGRLQGGTQLVIPSPVYTCDNGSEPQALSGRPLHEQLRNLTYVHDAQAENLTDNFGGVWLREVAAAPSPEPTTPPSEAEVTELLNGFLEARVAGEGAQQYLDVPEEDVPLLYATTSGAPYERAEFERVLGIEWPYGWMGFKVRLFAGDTVVEQLLFMGRPDGPLLDLEYQPDGFATDIAPTTEDGQPVAVPYNFFDGEVTLRAAHPWIMSDYGRYPFGRLIPEGPGVRPTTDGGERNDWDRLVLMADPVGTDCQTGPVTADAEALAESIRSDPDLGATAPVAVSVGGAEALMMDVVIAAGTTITVPADEQGNLCNNGVLSLVFDEDAGMYDNGFATGLATGDLMRLYLFDVPEGSSMRILVIAIVAPESRFERAVEAAAPVVDSVEFPTR